MKALITSTLALLTLAACDMPAPGFTISPDAMARGDAQGTLSVTEDVPRNINFTSNFGSDGVTYFRLSLQSQNQ